MTIPVATVRANRASQRMPVTSPATVHLTSGSKRCCGWLTDFAPTTCGVQISADALDGWGVHDLARYFSVQIHGEARQGLLIRMTRVKTGAVNGWRLAIKLAGPVL